MVTEDKPKKRYVPIAVTAKKVGEIDGEDILKIDMPIGNAGGVDDKKEKEKEEDDMGELSEAQVDKRFSELLGKMKLQETIDKIREKNDEIDEKIGKVDEKISERLSDTSERLGDLASKQEEISKKQLETCDGVDCLKKEIGKIDALKGDIGNLKDSNEKLKEMLGADFYKCSGPKGCNEDIKVGSSFCSNCGAKISEWEGHPEWVPYWKRQQK